MVRIVDRVAYINHDIDDAVRAGILAEADLPAEEIALLGPTGAKRIDTLVLDMVDALARGRRHRPVRRGRRRDAAAAEVHVRPRLPRGGGAGRARARRAGRCAACSTTTSSTRTRCPAATERFGFAAGRDIQRITDYLAGMTDRFCISTFKSSRLPEESRL